MRLTHRHRKVQAKLFYLSTGLFSIASGVIANHIFPLTTVSHLNRFIICKILSSLCKPCFLSQRGWEKSAEICLSQLTLTRVFLPVAVRPVYKYFDITRRVLLQIVDLEIFASCRFFHAWRVRTRYTWKRWLRTHGSIADWLSIDLCVKSCGKRGNTVVTVYM